MRSYLMALLLSTIFLVIGLFTLKDYGINWDAPFHMMRGQAYAHYFLTGKTTFDKPRSLPPVLIRPGEYLNKLNRNDWERGNMVQSAKLPDRPLFKRTYADSFYSDSSWDADYFLKQDGGGHPPLVDILAGFSNALFFQKIHVLGDIESYNVMYLFLAAIGVAIVSIFAYQITNSIFAGVAAGIFLALFPIFFSESHFNFKDPVQATFFAGAVWSVWHFLKGSKWHWFVIFVTFLALAMGVKWNIITLPIILALWFITIYKTNTFKRWFRLRKLLIFLIVPPVIIFLFLTVTWPAAWHHPWSHFMSVVNFYSHQGLDNSVRQPEGFILPLGINIYPLILTLTQTPPLIFIFFIVGTVVVFIRRGIGEEKVGHLLLIWIAIPLIRVVMPHTWFYNGFRQIMEIIPPIVIIAAIGITYLKDKILKLKLPRQMVELIILTVVIITLGFPIIHYYPFQSAYFNIFTGGISGAAKNNLIDWSLTYGSVYRQGINWLNTHAEKNANVAQIDGRTYALSPLWLRPDISISPYHFSGFSMKGEYVLLLTNPLDPAIFESRFFNHVLKPVYTVSVDGVSLLNIYKNDPKYAKINLHDERVLLNPKITQKKYPTLDFAYWDVNFDKTVLVTHIKTINSPPTCLIDRSSSGIVQFSVSDFDNVFDEKTINMQGSNIYIYQEGTYNRSDGGIDFVFGAEPAKDINIYPLDQLSCFSNNNIHSISYIIAP